jgi:hypothetical protein
VARAAGWIARLHERGAEDDPWGAPGLGLTPPGFGDGGLGWGLDYTNAFWLVGGLQAAVGMASVLGLSAAAEDAAARATAARSRLEAAMARDFVPGEPGYLPSALGPRERTGATSGDPRLQGQWGLLHAVYPLEVADPGNRVVSQTLACLAAAEREGLCAGLGWIADGIWTYAAGFWGLALLRAGRHADARRVLRAYMEHASPTFGWREEQSLRGTTPERVQGDMPHGWAWAMYLLLARGLLVLEADRTLRLLAGTDVDLLGPGVAWQGQPMRYGRLDLTAEPWGQGRWRLAARWHGPAPALPERVVVHAPEGLSFQEGTPGRAADGRTLTVDPMALRAGLEAVGEPAVVRR